jgi:hypothetical protein
MVRLNRTRADYLEKFQELIDSYNAGSAIRNRRGRGVVR